MEREGAGMVQWLSKVVYLIVGVTASLVCMGVGIYMIVDPTHDREALSLSAGVMGIVIGLFWLRMTWKGR